MAIRKPIFCKCLRTAWPRARLKRAWMEGRPLVCSNPECRREISVEMVEALLVKLKILTDPGEVEPPQIPPGFEPEPEGIEGRGTDEEAQHGE